MSAVIVGILSKGLVVEEVGDLVHHSHPMGPFEITRYPHYEIIKDSIKKHEGSLDYTLYINQLPEEAEGSEHLTDLPDELQQLQQQLLEASRVEVHSHDVEVDNSTGWPWYMATIPPGDFYDCLFLYFSCTDYEEPAWPGNKDKCTNLFDYCITYTEKNANSTDPKDPFVTKIPISSEIITTRPKPSTPTIIIELPSSESTSGQKPEKPAPSSEEPKPSSEIDNSEENSNGNQVSTETSDGKPASSSESPVEPIASSESSSSTTESSDNSQGFSEKPTSSETPPAISSEQPNEPEEPQVTVTQNPTNAPVSSKEPPTPDSSSQSESTPDIQEIPESTSETIVSSTKPSTTESEENAQNISETPDDLSETPQSTEVSEPPNKPQTQQETQKPSDSSTTQVSSEATTSPISTSSTESTSSATEESSPVTVGAQNQNAIVSGLPIPTKPSKPSVTTESSDVPEASSEPQKPNESESTPVPLAPQEDSKPSVTPISTTESPQLSESPSTSELPSSSESPSSSEKPPSSESPSSSESSVSSSEDPVSQETSSEAPSSSTVGAENQNTQVSGLPTPSTPKPASSSKPTPAKRPKKKPASCADLYTLKGIRESGTYPILVAGENITVYCDMETRGGGWTVLQRRGDFGTKEDYFLRKWDAYKQGFGNPEEDHWVGLKFWNNITLSTPQQLLIEMEDWFGNKTEIVVNNFIIGTEFFKFRIIYASIDGEFGESLPKKGTKFSTLDNDNDAWRNNCASRFKGAWWYSACHNSNLNGLYLKGEHESFGNGVNWYHWTGYHYSLKKTEMKVRVQSKAVSLGFLQNKKT